MLKMYESSDSHGNYRPADNAGTRISPANADDQTTGFIYLGIRKPQPRHPACIGHNTKMKSSQVEASPPLPTVLSPTSLVPFNYQTALKNHILNDKLGTGRSYDPRIYTPTFLHDCLQLPGALAALLGKDSPAELTHRMTPAILRGFRAHVDPETELPCLIASDDNRDYVVGMLVFGQGSLARAKVNAHYRPEARRRRVEVEFDVLVDSAVYARDEHEERQMWLNRRRTIEANAWVWRDVRTLDRKDRSSLDLRWNLNDYLEGKYSPPSSLNIVSYAASSTDEERANVVETNDAGTTAGYGTLEYDRSDTFTGW